MSIREQVANKSDRKAVLLTANRKVIAKRLIEIVNYLEDINDGKRINSSYRHILDSAVARIRTVVEGVA